MTPLRLLCYKSSLDWPRTRGHDVGLFHLMQEFSALGHDVGLATNRRPSDRALEGLNLQLVHALDEDPVPGGTGGPYSRLSGLRERFRSYWGMPAARVEAFGALVRAVKADVVVLCGLDALPTVGGVGDVVRVWFAGDEWVLHHLSLMQASAPATWRELKPAAIKGLYEFVYGGELDRVWVVTVPDRTAMRVVSRVSEIDIIPYGVDVDTYKPSDVPVAPHSAVFWGRLDFEPNIQALEWFVHKAWGAIRARHPQATFSVLGFAPGPAAQALAKVPGVTLQSNVPELPPVVSAHEVVVLPMVTGAGIKNKLLEAAAMSMPIVCTKRAMLGLQGTPPVVQADTPEAFANAVSRLWSNPAERTQLGADARAWVTREHTWAAAARIAAAGLERSVQAKRRR